jgi:hypothetical protein
MILFSSKTKFKFYHIFFFPEIFFFAFAPVFDPLKGGWLIRLMRRGMRTGQSLVHIENWTQYFSSTFLEGAPCYWSPSNLVFVHCVDRSYYIYEHLLFYNVTINFNSFYSIMKSLFILSHTLKFDIKLLGWVLWLKFELQSLVFMCMDF